MCGPFRSDARVRFAESSDFEFRLLMRLRTLRNRRICGLLYRHLLRRYTRATAPIVGRLHGCRVLLNPGNTYPFIVQDFPFFNAPLVELVHQVHRAKRAGLCLVDIGAAIGDTVLLVRSKCPRQVRKFKCIEGDPDFFQLLSANTEEYGDVEVTHAVLAREHTRIRSLVKHHAGTAAALGDDYVTAAPLDSLDGIYAGEVDILKIDVDGFDGEVLAGAQRLLSTRSPAVIFEWHPKLIVDTGNDPFAAFEALKRCDYQRYLWFNNVGTFSHFSRACSLRTLTNEMSYLLAVNARADEHFDVVALPDSSPIDDVELAALEYARSH
jgi:FkbM family methyltransferase